MKPIEQRRRRSARETFGWCKLRYLAEYVWDVDMSGEPARRGSAYHLAKSLYIRSLFAAGMSSDADLAQAALEQARTKLPLPHAEWLDVESIWSRWIPTFELNLSTFVSTEGAMPGFADTVLQFDLLELASADTLLCTDTKTHWRMPNTQDLRESYQTWFYLCAMRSLFPGFAHYQIRYSFDRFGQMSDVIELAPAELDAMEVSIRESDAAMSAAEDAMSHADDSTPFQATGGKHCGTCKALCHLADHEKRELVRAQTGNEAALMVAKIEVARRNIGIYTEALRAWCEDHGTAESGGIVWAHHPVERVSYDLRDVVDVLKANDVKLDTVPKSVFQSSHSHLKALTHSRKKWGWIADKIKALGTVNRYTQFEGKTTKPDADEKPEDAEVDGNK